MTSPTKLCMIIRNILVVLVIYDYFSVVVCECQPPITVPNCPGSSHAWSLKAEDRCTMKDKYHCLITENYNEDKSDLIECCMPYKNISRGHMPRYNTIKKTIQEIACDNGYYMNNTFASNKYRRNGVEHCNDKKSACVDMKGMKIYDNGNTTEDRKCYCDYKNDYKPYITLDPNVVYFYDKDNYCIRSGCLEFQELNMMYQCVNVCKDGEYRPEESMDCIPKSSTSTPPVVVSINGSTETTTKYTPEDTIEQTETTDYKLILIPVVLVVVVILAIICYVIMKTCKDGIVNCCVFNRDTMNVTTENFVSGSGNKIQVNVDPEEKVPLILMENIVPIIELKGLARTFNVDEGNSVAIECNINYEKKYRPPFWERINEDDEKNILTIRENKKDKYFGLKSDPPYFLRILNAEMSDRGYYRCCMEYSTSNGEETMRSEKAHLIVEKVSAPGQPRNIKAKVFSHNRIEVSWRPPTDSANIRSYNVYFNDSSVMEHPNNSYVLENVIPDTVYHIQVSATSTNGREGEKTPMIEVKRSPLVPIIELKGLARTFNVDEGNSVAIECNINYEKKYRPPFWERINEDDEKNILTIRENKKDKYFGLKSDPPYFLRILNAEMSDRGYYRCCMEYSTSNGEETMRSEKAHLIVEKAVKPGDTLIDQQTIIKVKSMTANTVTMGGDGTNIIVNNTSEKKKEKANTSIGSSSSSSSKNETSENFDKMEKGTQNSDCGQEPGDVDINKEKKSKMNPVPATEQGGDEKNINGNSINEDTEEKMNTLKGSNSLSEKNMSNNCDEMEKGTHNSDSGHETGDNGINKEEKSGKKNISEIETIATKHGFSVKNVPGDGNCMFHAIALQLPDNNLKNKIGEERSKELRFEIVEFLKKNDTTPTGEKYSSFVGENDREIKWSTYLTSMRKPGNFGDEIILRAVSHCFNVRIRVLSTASPERFIDYNSPNNSSTVYLGFIDKSLHYVRLQPKSTGNIHE